MPRRPAIFDRNVLAVDVAEFAQSLAKSGEIPQSPGVVRSRGGEDADHRHWLLLRAGREGIRRRAAKHEHDTATFHSIASSARARIDGGTFKPSASAVLRLTTSSNVVGS